MLLLIFFLLASNLVLKTGVEVSLPVLQTNIAIEDDANLLVLSGTGIPRVHLNDNLISMDDLAENLATIRNERPDSRQLVILADETVSYRSIARTTQLGLEAGLQVSLAGRGG